MTMNIRKKIGWFLENTNALYIHKEERLFKYKTLQLDNADIGVTAERHCDREVIVSLTSYGERINDCYLAIVSLMYQTVRANRIILWLSESEFNGKPLPRPLCALQERGLTIGYTKDIKSYKKIVPTLLQYPDANIITVDDDVIYPVDFIERMVVAHNKYSGNVYFFRGCRIAFNKKGEVLPYRKWKRPSNDKPQFNLPTGIGGVFYPMGCFNKDVTREELFMRLCPKADDLWLKVMCMLNGYGAVCIAPFEEKHFETHFIEIEGTQSVALNKSNLSSHGENNDTQFRRLIDHYDINRFEKWML